MRVEACPLPRTIITILLLLSSPILSSTNDRLLFPLPRYLDAADPASCLVPPVMSQSDLLVFVSTCGRLQGWVAAIFRKFVENSAF